METSKISNEPRTLEDIIFEDRNKAYGAYALNRHCTKYLLIAFLISLTGVATAVAVPFIKVMNNPPVNRLPVHNVKVNMVKIDIEPVHPVLPPALPKRTEQVAQYAPPLIVEEPREDHDMGIMIDLIDKYTKKPLPDVIIYVGDTSGEIPENVLTDFVLHPEESATFLDGDLSTFAVWVQKNIVYPQKAIDHGIFGKVFVEFCVNSMGQVVDIQILRGVDPSLEQETIRVLMSSPLWRAARQGGRPVKQKFSIPVVYQLD